MQTVNIQAARAHLSRLVDAAAAGEEIVIARAGKPLARLVPLAAPRPSPNIVFGLLDDKLGPSPDDFDAPLPDEVLDLFEGR
jgi:prevent-host-death family protein